MFAENIQLAAGESAILESTGKITLRLLHGTAEIAGRPFPSNETASFRSARSGLHFYSLEGGAVAITSTAPFHLSKSSTPIASLGPMMRTFLASTPSHRGPLSFPGARVLVLGKKSSGKTLAARTFVNFLFRDSVTQRRGSNSIENVTLICGDPLTSGCDTTVAPGCISAVRVSRPGISVNAPFLENPHVTFFKAAASVGPMASSSSSSSSSSGKISSPLDEAQSANVLHRENSAQSLHWLSQAIESSNGVLGSSSTITVVDAPGFWQQQQQQETPESNNNTMSSAILENFYSNLIEIVDPSLILFVGGSNGSNMYGYGMNNNSNADNNDFTPEARTVKQIVDKLNAQQNSSSPIEFVALESFVSSASSSKNKQPQQQQVVASSSSSSSSENVADRIEDYFCGPPSLPMKCAKIVVPLNKITFLTISKSVHSSNSNSNNNLLTPSRVDVAKHFRSLAGRVCAVSLAAVEAETVYANVAGLVLIESIDVNENELVLFAPAGGNGPEDTCVVRPFLLLGDARLTYRHLNDSARGMDSVEANSI